MSVFLNEHGLWWPEADTKHGKAYDFIKRNAPDLETGMRYCKNTTVALQAGGHVGVFPNYLSGVFNLVYTFEPDPDLFEALRRNAKSNVVPIPRALAAAEGTLKFITRSCSGRGHVHPDGPLEVVATTIDAMCLKALDFLHLDVERYEMEVIKGALRTLREHSPIIQMEVLPDQQDEVLPFMARIGYRPAHDRCRDTVFLRSRA